jgi:hypothetical protein
MATLAFAALTTGALTGPAAAAPSSQRRFIPGRHRAYAFHLLSHVVSYQRWGMPGAQPRGWHVYFKGGFVPGPVGWVTHQVALLRHRRHRLGIAVLTYSPTLAYGAKTIHGVTRRLVGSYAAPRR